MLEIKFNFLFIGETKIIVIITEKISAMRCDQRGGMGVPQLLIGSSPYMEDILHTPEVPNGDHHCWGHLH